LGVERCSLIDQAGCRQADKSFFDAFSLNYSGNFYNTLTTADQRSTSNPNGVLYNKLLILRNILVKIAFSAG